MKFDVGQHNGWHHIMVESYELADSWKCAAMSAWGRETFGPPSDSRWQDDLYGNYGTIYFRDEADRTLFLMRWGG